MDLITINRQCKELAQLARSKPVLLALKEVDTAVDLLSDEIGRTHLADGVRKKLAAAVLKMKSALNGLARN